MSKKKPYYGEKTKKKIVFDYESSTVSAIELAKLHGVLGSNTVSDWIKKYGNLQKSKPAKMPKETPEEIADEKKKRLSRQRTYEQMRISELETELDEARLRVRFYACAITVASESTGIDLLKKIGEQLLRN